MSNGRLPLEKIGSLTIAFASTGAGDPPGRGWLLLLLFFVLAGGNSRSTRLSSRCCFHGWTWQRPMLSGGMMMHITEAAASLKLHRAAVEAGGIFAKGRHILEWRHGCVWVGGESCWHFGRGKMKLDLWRRGTQRVAPVEAGTNSTEGVTRMKRILRNFPLISVSKAIRQRILVQINPEICACVPYRSTRFRKTRTKLKTYSCSCNNNATST